jgi:hypothetical protein
VIVCLFPTLRCHHPRKRMIQYSRNRLYGMAAQHRAFSDYWMPAFAGMTLRMRMN